MPDNESEMFIRNADVFREMLKRYLVYRYWDCIKCQSFNCNEHYPTYPTLSFLITRMIQ